MSFLTGVYTNVEGFVIGSYALGDLTSWSSGCLCILTFAWLCLNLSLSAALLILSIIKEYSEFEKHSSLAELLL